MQPTDTQLVQNSLAGDKTAFGELVKRYQGLIYGLAYYRVGNFADAQDIAQEVFVKALQRLSQLDQPEHFAAWIKSTTVNECKMWLRGNRWTIPLDDAETLPAYAALAEDDWKRRERQAEVRRSVDLLPVKSRLVVTLHYLSGLSHQEIGKFLGVAANAVSQQLHRARQQLKDMLMAEIEESYVMNKLPDSFAEEVLGRVTVFPVVDQQFIVAVGEGDIRGLMMRVNGPGPKESIITLWMRQNEFDARDPMEPGQHGGNPKEHAFEVAIGVFDALGIKMKQVTLRLADSGQCRAAVEFEYKNAKTTVDMRPSDALCLAMKANVPIYAEDSVVQQGDVAEDDVPIPKNLADNVDWIAALNALHQHDLLRDKAFEIGLSPEDMIDTARFCIDEEQEIVRMWLEAVPEREAILNLEEYRLGVEKMFEFARDCYATELIKGGEHKYKVFYTMLGEEARLRIVPEEDYTQFQHSKPAS